MMARVACVLRGKEAAAARPLLAPGPGAGQLRRIAREGLEARLEAERLVQEARERAGAIVAEAREVAGVEREEAARAAREEADTQLAARWLALRAAESRALGGDVDRVVTLARLLAERLVGASLALDPARIATLAAGVLAEARGARRAVLEANPLDAAALRGHLASAGLDPLGVEIRDDGALARGALRLHTDVGIIDAQLAPRLERLAEALRDALR